MAILTIDRQGYSITKREFTDQGYLRVPGRVAKTGVQQYLASELELADRNPNDVINVYRPPEEVFKAESLATYQNADVTDNHPDRMVDADTFKKYAVGHTLGEGRAEGDFVVVDMIIKDKAAIKAIESGKAELSAGYTNDYVLEPGVAPDGTEYEYVQRNIRINHIALVDRARAGKEAKLFDHKPRGLDMSTITLDGNTIEVADKATAQLIQRSFDMNNEKLKEMQDKYKSAMDEAEKLKQDMEKMKAESDAKDEELEKEKEKSSDEAVAEKLKEVSAAKDAAIKIAGPDFSCDSVNPMVIKKEALKKARPTVDWDAKSEHYIAAAWDMASTESPQDRARQSRDGVSADLARLYTSDSGQMKGNEEYRKFLTGGNA